MNDEEDANRVQEPRLFLFSHLHELAGSAVALLIK